MRWHNALPLGLVLAGSVASAGMAQQFGRVPSPAEIKLWDIDVRQDGKGLPHGSGTALRGKVVFEESCTVCHGVAGKNGIKDRLVGGQGSLATNMPIKTVGSYWPYATTLYDYIHRAMPYQAPGTLSVDDTYAVSAYILSLNGIISADSKLDQTTLPKVRMPNRDGFVPEPEFSKVPKKR